MLILVTYYPPCMYYIWDLPQVSEDGHVVDNIVETNGHVCPPNPGKQREHFINCCLFSGWNFISVYQQMDHTERGQLVAASLYSIPVQLKTLYNYNFTTFFKTFSPLDSQNSWSVSLFKTTGGIGLILKVVQHMVTSCVCLMYVYSIHMLVLAKSNPNIMNFG